MKLRPNLYDHLQATQDDCRSFRPERPFISLCFAQSLDGCLAWAAGTPTHLSQSDSLKITHQLRSLHQGIVIGAGTLCADDPLLNVRYVNGPSPRPIVLDTHGRSPAEARLFQHHPLRPILATGEDCQRSVADDERTDLLRLPLREGRIDLLALLAALQERGLDTLMVEGGGEVISSFLAAQLCDFMVINMTPFILGQKDSVRYKMPSNQLLALEPMGTHMLGQDIWIWGRPRWRPPYTQAQGVDLHA